MFLPQVSYSGSYPLGNLYYVSIKTPDLRHLKYLAKFQIVLIQLTTTIMDPNIIEPLITPKVITDKNY